MLTARQGLGCAALAAAALVLGGNLSLALAIGAPLLLAVSPWSAGDACWRIVRVTGVLVVLLAVKDLLPGGALSGHWIRALEPASPLWVRLARNPDLPAAAEQLGALLFGGVVAATVAGLRSRRQLSLEPLAAGFQVLALAVAVALLLPAARMAWMPGVASKNAAATLVALGGAMAAAGWLETPRPTRGFGAAGRLAFAALVAAALIQARSATGVVALLAALAVCGAVAWRRQRVPVAGSVFVASGLLAVVVFSGAGDRLAAAAGDFRWEIWGDALRIATRAPLWGHGCGSFARVQPLLGRLELAPDAYLAHPDSSYLLALVEWGAVPVVLAVVLVVRAAWRRWRHGPPVSLPLLAATLVVLVAAVTDPVLHRPATFLVAAVLLGAWASPPARGDEWDVPQAPSPHGRWSWIGAVAVVMLTVVVTARWAAAAGKSVQWRPLSPALQASAGASGWQRSPRAPAARDHLRAALQLTPWSPSYALFAATVVHADDSAAARAYWVETLRRGREMAGRWMDQAQAQFPTTPADYWAGVARDGWPRAGLNIRTADSAIAARIAESWLAEAGTARTQDWQRFLAWMRRHGAAHLLLRQLARLQREDAEVVRDAATVLSEAGYHEAAWTLVSGLYPRPAAGAPSGSASPGPRALLALRWYPALQRYCAQPDFRGDDALALLTDICARPDAPPWFRVRLAWALADAHRETEAVAWLLRPPART